jgi:hypothetical protein
MSKFKFVSEENHFSSPISTKTVEFSAVIIEDVLQEFENFLLGCGFKFDGKVDIIKDDEIDIYKELEELEAMELSISDKDYFGNLPQNNWPFAKIQPTAVCPVCKIDNETMSKHVCYDSNCPKGNKDADQG